MTITSVQASGNGISGLFAQLQGAEGFGDLLGGLMAALRGNMGDGALPDGLLAQLQATPEGQKFLASAGENMLSDASLASLLGSLSEGGSAEEMLADFKAMVTELREIAPELAEKSGGLSVEQIAQAFEESGLSAKEAKEKASRMVEMIGMMDSFRQGDVMPSLNDVVEQADSAQDLLAALKDEVALQKKRKQLDLKNNQENLGMSLKVAEAFANAERNISPEEIVHRVLKGEKDLQPEQLALSQKKTAMMTASQGQTVAATAKPAVAVAQRPAVDSLGDMVAEMDADVDPEAALRAADESYAEHVVDSRRQAAEDLRGVKMSQDVATQSLAQAQAVAKDERITVRRENANMASNQIAEEAAVEARPAKIEYISTRDMDTAETPKIMDGRVVVQVKVADDGAAQMQDLDGNLIDATSEEAVEEFFSKLVDRAGGADRPNPLIQQGAASMRNAQVAQQVSMAMRASANDGGGQVKMMLNPPELGEIEIALKVHEGKVSAQISAQSAEVVEQMARDLRSLQQGLQASGFEIGEEGFTFLLKDQNAGDGQGEQNGSDSETFFAEGDETEANDAIAADAGTPKRWVKPDSLVDQVV